MEYYFNLSDYTNFLRPPDPGAPDDIPAAPDLDYYYDSAKDWVNLRSEADPVMTSWASWSPVDSNPGMTFDVTEEITTEVPLGLEFENDDAAWVMACTFIIFSMQTGLSFPPPLSRLRDVTFCFAGFGLIESGMCSMKNEVNILVKNIVDVAVGGFVFWVVGFGLVMGDHPLYSNWF